jgi:hypothetical protein
MSVRIQPWIGAAAALALSAQSSLAAAAPANAVATGHALVLRPVTVVKLKDLDFGIVWPSAAGTAVIEPDADVMTTTGGLVALGGSPHSAEFAGAANTSAVVIIKLPKQPVVLTRVGGTQTVTVSNFTLQGQSKRAIAAQAWFSFRVGGTLNVAANQADGTYVGTFDVTVQYP